ncbi:sugar nucleotide-binding protein [Flavobacteriaceae bacterium F08102]|nr:sugar nucleotide-binding protein [Flavobacteriaceae bacterium F08102]
MQKDSQRKTVLILGASSWLGYSLVQQLVPSDYRVVGTVYKAQIEFPANCRVVRLPYQVADYRQCLEEVQPDSVVNFLRGEDEIGAQIHAAIIAYAQQNTCHYLYASSALALDGYNGEKLIESLEAKSVTPYGQFKARCEAMLKESTVAYAILRFASVQGWVPHKITRNQALLEKLAKGESIIVDRGVVQNRILASLLIEGVELIIRDRITGTLHFGSQDHSEEYHFLQAQAERFGYDKNRIQAGGKREVNLAVIPERMLQLYGDRFLVYEKETLTGLTRIEGLKKYIYEG